MSWFLIFLFFFLGVYVLFISFLLGVLLSVLLFLLNMIISKKSYFGSTPFECGFSGVGRVQVSYSIHYFILLLVFVIFDLELVLLLGLVFISVQSVVLFFILFTFMLSTYYVELVLGKIKWFI